MKNDFDISILSTAEVWRRGYQGIVNNAGKAIAAITLIIASLVMFTDIGIIRADIESFTCTLLLMLIASYIMYFSMESAGEKLGMESEEYTGALSSYKEIAAKISPDMIYELREFCMDYTESEARYRRESMLAEYGLCYEDYISYTKGELLNSRDRRIFRRVSRIKPARLTPKELMTVGHHGGGELSNPERTRIPMMLIKMIPTTVCTLFTASIVLGAKSNLDAPTVIEGLLKLSTLPIIGLRGYTSGYFFAKGNLTLWIETKRKLLEAFEVKRGEV